MFKIGVHIVIRFVIVDDKIDIQEEIKQVIRKTVFNMDLNIEIKCFTRYNELLRNVINDTSIRTIYLLDIDLKHEISGINISLKIREHDWNSEIIFLTYHDKYFEKVYRNIYKVFDFIEKFDNMKKRLAKDIKMILSQEYDVKMFKYSNRQIDLQIHMKDILYIYRETDERKLVIVTSHNKFMISKNINDILKDLDDRFEQTHRSCIANMQHVNLLKWNEGSFILDNKEEIFLLSKKYKDKIKNKALV